ncbi:uncharacterized protein OCT59_019539 [Rhizophagus irregularis]|uniref:Uncharacterized protein n=1 Tax=Rhizophagus irregularis (strain DAOM 197198w) TaxID=1432141 RepID=A0A015K2G7_RHIIW|nr:hypothetical protein RirG_164290 [Rhizophagus irregularis DAOM 197198w]EXX73840.1 hypothetical protein RirG_056710 [Rhizophagus irregularis DAOM 197198w]UZO27341.1 hypothetical protein OCT59_019539 [Rhizophagus irregularis]GBC51555.2 hypothetical protein GLOIN_2v1769868 [Rhizophagus irregularis DAOM 181602=DAOM 197198]
MVERVDLRICRTVQNETNNHPLRKEERKVKKSNFTQISSDMAYHHIRYLGSTLDLCLPSFKKDYARDANKLCDNEFKTVSGKFDNNSTVSEITTSNCECNVLKRDFKAKRNGDKIHDGCVSSLSITGTEGLTSIKSKEDVTMDIKLSNCSNCREIESLEAQFGKLFRVGSLCGYDWTGEILSQPCRLVHAHSRTTQESTSAIECQGTVRHLRVCDRTNCFSSGSNNSPNSLILVDTFEKSGRSQIATFISCKVNTNSDPKELVYYIANVADFGFNHIIIFGETYYGMIFLDCFGRVFIWEDTFQMAYPLGDSLKEAQNNSIEGIAWFVENGIVYEYIKEPQRMYAKNA